MSNWNILIVQELYNNNNDNNNNNNNRIPISEGLQAASGKGKFQSDNRNGFEKYNDGDEDEWFLGVDEKGKVCS